MSTGGACCICLEPLAADLSATKCGHVLHKQCMLQCIATKKQCPICRTKLRKKSVFNLFLKPVDIAIRALREPSEVLRTLEGNDKAEMVAALKKLKGGAATKSVHDEGSGKSLEASALKMFQKKIHDSNIEIGCLKLDLEKKQNNITQLQHQTKVLGRENARQRAESSTLLQKSKKIEKESRINKNQMKDLHTRHFHAANKLSEVKQERDQLKKKCKKYELMESFSSSVENSNFNQINQLETTLNNKTVPEQIDTIKMMYLHIKNSHKQMKKSLGEVEKSSKKDLQSIRNQRETLGKDNLSLRDQLSQMARSLKKYKEKARFYKNKSEKMIHSEDRTPVAKMLNDSLNTSVEEAPRLGQNTNFPLVFDSSKKKENVIPKTSPSSQPKANLFKIFGQKQKSKASSKTADPFKKPKKPKFGKKRKAANPFSRTGAPRKKFRL